VQFGLLGPLVVADAAGGRVEVSGQRLRVLLAALLLHANTPVSGEVLAVAVWDGAPGPAAVRTLRSHIARLRRLLGPEAGRVAAREPGYLIRAKPSELDVAVFEALCHDADTALRAGAWAEASGHATRALALWRGPALADVPSQPLYDQIVPRLEQLRLQALEDNAQAGLHLGHHERLVPQLRDLAASHPLRERFHAQLMLALARAGRQAEALTAYQHARRALVDELGIEPGPELRNLHERILASDTALLTSSRPESTYRPSRPPETPRQLPADVRHFVGRTGELQALSGLLPDNAQAGGPVVISAIGGTAGVGKTALAVHWAHLHTDRFPDGQLYVNLRGYDPGQPMPATDALAGFLRSLGVPGQGIPPEEDERAAQYRSLLAGKQMLVVLDNAGSADQVRPLLPATPGCTVVVTSRDALAGLVARDGATRLDLDVLPTEEAAALLRALIGARADAEPDAAAELAEQCCRLPLALRVAAELAASRPAMPLVTLTGELADLRTRLDMLDASGDLRTQVRAVFSWSYRHLGAEAARTFRLLGLHPGPDLEPYAAVALTSTTVPQGRRALDVLARAHLIQPAAPGRYAMHDLLRGYARELSATVDGGQEQHAALTRLFDYYLHTAATAMDTLYPAERHRRPRTLRPDTPVPPLADSAAAREWLDGERPALVAAARHTAACGWPGHTTRLAPTLSSYLRNGGYISEARTIFSHALGAARRAGDRAAMATVLNEIGQVDCHQSRIRQAADHYRQALALFREAGDQAGEAFALGNIGLSETGLGRYRQAARHQQEAVVICRDIGDRSGEARALGNLGLAWQRQGRYQEAVGYQQQSLELCREIGDRGGEAWALARLGVVDLRLGRCQHAAGYLRQALDLFHDMGNRVDEAQTLAKLGGVYLRLGRYEQATKNFEQALAVFREIGDLDMEADALIGLGDVLLHTGEADRARAHHTTALRLASKADTLLQQARAHSGLACAYQADGDPVQARHHWQQALTRYTAIGAPESDEIRVQLAGVEA